MARQLQNRFKITGTITAQTPLHVGGLGTDPTVDLSLAVDGQNRLYIPGTSLAGAFRNWMMARDMDVDKIWGYQRENKGYASFTVIEDALITLPEGAIAELRDHVGIDRIWGAANPKTKFDRAILPRGSRFPLEMTVDVAQEEPIALENLEQLLSTLQTEGLRLGAAQTRGLGLIRGMDMAWRKYDLSHFSGMIAALKQSGQVYQPATSAVSRLLRLSIHWQPTGALMVKSGQDGVAVDMLPLVSRDRDQVAFVLPGSAIKGAMRSQAERILRTVLGRDVPPTDKLQDQMEDPALELAQWLFGKSGTGDKTTKVSLGRGALTVDDCFCEKKLNPAHWQAIEATADDPQQVGETLRGSLDAAGLTDTQQAFHVAIDRWTGGAADQMLYSALEPFNLRWEPIELSVDLDRIDDSQRGAVQALLFLTLRDLALGRIPLGYGVNRGYGALTVDKIVVRPPTEPEQTLTFSRMGEIHGLDLVAVDRAWRTWLEQAKSQQLQEVVG
jgi:CRISPR/Cas system CSM-associated protein Csm3 (group 7 of RAMP superfamily)